MKVDFGGVGHYKNGVVTVNIDPDTNPDLLCDISPRAHELEKHFKNDSLDQISAFHVLEHMKPEDLFPSLTYWRTFLNSRGRLLVVVPDMETELRHYAQGLIEFETVASIAFNRTPYADQSPYQQHYWMFTRSTLSKMLVNAGYYDIEPFGAEIYPDAWQFDSPGMHHDGDWKRYAFPNLRLLAYKLPFHHGGENVTGNLYNDRRRK